MALTPLRWSVIAAVGAVIAATMLMAPREQQRPTATERQRLSRVANERSGAAARAADQLRVVQIRDSVRHVLMRMRATDSARVIFGPGLNNVRRALEPSLSRNRQAVAGARFPVDVVVLLDSTRRVRGVDRGPHPLMTADYALPRVAGERCLVILRLRSDANVDNGSGRIRLLNTEMVADRLYGPCAYYGTFGMPGRQIDEWLRRSKWTIGIRNDWRDVQPAWRDPRWASNEPLINARSSGWPLRSFVSPQGYRCIAGVAETCEEVLLAGAARSQSRFISSRFPETWGDMVSAGGVVYAWWRSHELGPSQASLLSDMVHQIGQERFASFWRSEAPPPDAFRQATSRDLGAWTAEWSRDQYGERGLGPSVSFGGVLFAFLMIAVATAGTFWFSSRRQVA